MAKINKDLFGEIAVQLQIAIEDEGEALKKYQAFLNIVQNNLKYDYIFKVFNPDTQKDEDSSTAKADKKMMKLICETIKEYMAEEMKHLKGLMTLYEAITGIKAETK